MSQIRLRNCGSAVIAYRIDDDGKREMLDVMFNKWHPKYWLDQVKYRMQDIRRRITGFFWRRSRWCWIYRDIPILEAEVKSLKKALCEHLNAKEKEE